MKTPIVLGFLFLLLTSCNPSPKSSSAPAVSADPGTTTTGSSGGKIEAQIGPVVRVMNYNQFNITLSKLTGINQSKVSSLFNEIKGSMPAEGAIEAMTSFNLVAKSRLADAYCSMYVLGERDPMTDALISGGIPPLADAVIPEIKNHLLTKFLDYDASNPAFDNLEAELDNVMANKDGQGGALVSANLTTAQMNRNLGVIACITILASSHITLLE